MKWGFYIEFMKSLWKKYGRAFSVCLLIAGIYLVMFGFGITCPIRYIWGVSCPGCGMTRACLSALRLDFSAAFVYHPLWVLLLPTVIVIAICFFRKWTRVLRVVVMAAAIALCVVYALRVARATGDVVVFEPQNGLLGRGIRAIFDGISG